MGCMAQLTQGDCTGSAPAPLAATVEVTPSGSESTFSLGVGMEGKVRAAGDSLPASAVTSAVVFAADLASSLACGIAPNRTIVANSIGSPQCCESNSVPIRNDIKFTVLRVR